MPDALPPETYLDLVHRALAEDVGSGDVTTIAVVPPDVAGRGVLLAREPLVVAGLDVAHAVFTAVDPHVSFRPHRADGDTCGPGEALGEVAGPAAALLTAERTALNLLQYLCGIATVSRRYVEAAGGRLVVLDTRKTTPGLRALAKYAVRCGGASNHRSGLYDAVSIKDNHIRIAGGVAAAVRRVREEAAPGPIEVEAQDLAQVDEALEAGADVIMLDNFDDASTARAITKIAGRARIELSGNMTIDRVRRLAASGADMISVGALTHSAPAADISLEITT